MTESPHEHGLLSLPAELLQQIFSYLEPLDLAYAAQTCRQLCTASYDEQLWQHLVNRNLPYPTSAPTPLNTFRELYVRHHPHWFLARQAIWFADSEPSGKLLVASYDPQRGRIEAHAVVARRGLHSIEFWEKDREVVIHGFNPTISLDRNQSVLKLEVDSPRTEDQPKYRAGHKPLSRYGKEVLMETFAEAGLYSSFMLCRKLPDAAITEQTRLWPTLRLPATSRTRNDTRDGYSSSGHRPTRLDEVSEDTFRLRKWVEYTGRRSSPNAMSFTSPNGLSAALGRSGPYFASTFSSTEGGGMSIRMPEDITTYSTLPKSAYTPTKEKPWQGIWCGDYSGHGYEFLVVVQPDKQDEVPLPEAMTWLRDWFRGGRRRGSDGSTSSYASAQEDADDAATELLQSLDEQDPTTDAHVPPQTPAGIREVLPHSDVPDAPTGRLEAIKLTGDPNIPRGEYTFIAPDIGPGGLLRVADEEIFKGARVVRSAGHIAERGFRDGMTSYCIAAT